MSQIQKLLFATNNKNKIREVKAALGDNLNILTLQEAGIVIEIPEPHQTLEENALEKAMVINRITGENCFAEDTGLEVKALNGEPGVNTARYAGEERSNEKNIDKLLTNLSGKKNRNATFRTIISLIINTKQYTFEGICKGAIVNKRQGLNGFGYDPVFMPEGSNKTLAEMSMDEKNIFSHRAKAVEKLINFLQTQIKQQSKKS